MTKFKNKNYNDSAFSIAFWVLSLESMTIYVRNSLVDNIIQGIAIMIILVMYIKRMGASATGYKAIQKINFIELGYCGLIIMSIFASIVHGDIFGIIQAAKVFLPIIILIIVSDYFSINNYIPKIFIQIPIFYAILISIQSIILFAIVYFDLSIGSQWVINDRYLTKNLLFDFFLGNGNAINYTSTNNILRATAYFLEPSNLSSFLFMPMIYLFFKLQDNKSIRNLFCFICVLCCFVITFSRAGYIALGIAIFYYLLLKRNKGNVTLLKDIIYSIFMIIFAVLIGTGILSLMQHLSETLFVNNPISIVLGRDSEAGLVRNASSYDIIFDKIALTPIGYGLGATSGISEFNNPSAFGFWLYASGILGFVLLVVMIIYIFIKFAIPCMKSKNIINKTFGISFVAILFQNLSYGTFCNYYFMYILSMIILLNRREMNKRNG